jgi:hypothetical protein
MKSYTNISQSKKLMEILPLETADMGWNVFVDGTIRILPVNDWDLVKDGSGNVKFYPAWSLAALINILPSEFTEKGKYSKTTYDIRIRKYTLIEDLDLYQITYGNYIFYEDGNSDWKDMINTGEKENLIDAVFQMIIWLKENNKL